MSAEERWEVGLAVVLRRVPNDRFLGESYISALLDGDTSVFKDRYSFPDYDFFRWVGGAPLACLHRLAGLGAVERRHLKDVRVPKSARVSRKTRHAAALSSSRRDIESFRATDLAPLYIGYMTDRAREAFDELPMSATTMFDFLAELGDDPDGTG